MGVEDDLKNCKHDILGLEKDLSKPGEKGNKDGLELRLTNIINNSVGANNSKYVHPSFRASEWQVDHENTR